MASQLPKKVVISLGGSTIVPEEIDIEFLKDFRKLILKYIKKGMTFVLISGGGRSARHYQHAASKIAKLDAEDLDWIGVHSTRLNAQLLRTIFRGTAYERVIKDPTKPILTNKKIIIAAGWKPGFSTDYDAVLLAKNLGVDTVVNMSNVPYVYDKNPRKFRNAKPIKELSWVDYIKMVGMEWRPGRNVPFDPIASTEAHKSEIRVVVLGNDLQNFENFLLGKKFEGTLIS